MHWQRSRAVHIPPGQSPRSGAEKGTERRSSLAFFVVLASLPILAELEQTGSSLHLNVSPLNVLIPCESRAFWEKPLLKNTLQTPSDILRANSLHSGNHVRTILGRHDNILVYVPIWSLPVQVWCRLKVIFPSLKDQVYIFVLLGRRIIHLFE